MATAKQRFSRSWKFMLAIIAPIMLLPVLFAHDDEMIPNFPYQARSDDVLEPGEDADDDIVDEATYKSSRKFKLAYVILVMAVYWAFEVIPLPITSLFPLVMFPLLGIDDAANVSKSYMKESNTIFLGGAIVALAVEYCHLHRRVALRFITIVGVSPRRLMFGIMVAVSFLAMWISNVTCTTMIVPIIVAIVDEIHEVTDATNEDIEANNNNSKSPAIFRRLHHQHSFPSRGGSLRSNPTGSLYKHSSAFQNAALSSHHDNQGISEEEEDGQRSTLGVLQGRRSSSEEEGESSHVQDESHNPSSHAYIINVENNNSEMKRDTSNSNLSKLAHNQLTRIRMELEQEQGKFPPLSTGLKRSASEPGRMEEMVDAPPRNDDKMNESEKRRKAEKEKWRKIKNMYLFALAYAANIGGTATITGTGPNKVFKEVIKPYSSDISNGGSISMTFFTWMAYNVPPMLVNIGVAFTYLTFRYYGIRTPRPKTKEDEEEHAIQQWKDQHVRSYLKEEYKKLGKMNFHEIGVAAVFLLVVFLWILRDPQIFTGWNELSPEAQSGDSTCALLGAVLLFIIPKSWSFLTSKDNARFEGLLDWKIVTQKLPWGVLLLLGSGYAIGDSADRTGLSRWIAKELYELQNLPQPVLLLIVMLITAFITEVVSNTACASIILPVLLGLSRELKMHPLYLSVAASVTASYAFMLPVASPVNAIVFAAGDFSIREMITNGYILNGICVIIFYVNTLTLGEWLFKFSDFKYPPSPTPKWGPVDSYNISSLAI